MANMPLWRITNGWREIFARIFEQFETQFGVAPEWLVNPVTSRRLKLDLFYPAVGVAVRFEGMRGKKHKRRLSLEEEAQERTRTNARVAVCREHGVELIVVDVTSDKLSEIFQRIDLALSRAQQTTNNTELQKKVKAARSLASSLSHKVRSVANLGLYADLWEDRQYQIAEPDSEPPPPAPAIDFTEGMEVEHVAFGPGVILSTAPSNGDTLIEVDFVTAGQKTLAASLVANKLKPR